MILALFSDVHGNREAFDACLADARARGAERCVFLGDLVGYGADPSYVVETVMDLAASGAIAVKGNHDVAIASGAQGMNHYARAAIDWTRDQLAPDQKAFLEKLPLTASLDDLFFVHGDASDPGCWIYVMGPIEAEHSMRAAVQQVTFSGHVHRPLLASMPLDAEPSRGQAGSAIVDAIRPHQDFTAHLDRAMKWHVVLGAVGQPRDENPAAAYAVYDTGSAVLSFARVAYDIAKAASKIQTAGLPSMLGDRLFFGR